jgi:GNAT superfamily N-acetyltransferase
VNETKPICQTEKYNPIWWQLLDVLANLYEGKLEIFFPTIWNRHYFSWFHSMEQAGFRRELHYSFKQLTKTLEKKELVFWFVTVEGKPQILLFGYSIPDGQTKSFYLDTFAVKPRGKGIGNIIMEYLIRWAKTKNFKTIVLDTELKDEKGIPLQQFYANHGFETVSNSGKGDLIMKRVL